MNGYLTLVSDMRLDEQRILRIACKEGNWALSFLEDGEVVFVLTGLKFDHLVRMIELLTYIRSAYEHWIKAEIV